MSLKSPKGHLVVDWWWTQMLGYQLSMTQSEQAMKPLSYSAPPLLGIIKVKREAWVTITICHLESLFKPLIVIVLIRVMYKNSE